MPKNTYFTQKYTYWSKYLFLECLPQKPRIMQNNYVSVCLLGMRSCNMADTSRYSVLNLMRSSFIIYCLYVTISYSDAKFWISVFVLCIQLCTWLLSMRRRSMLQYLFWQPLFLLKGSLDSNISYPRSMAVWNNLADWVVQKSSS